MYKKQIRKFCSSWNALVGLCQAWQVVESSLGSSKGKCERTAEVVSRGGAGSGVGLRHSGYHRAMDLVLETGLGYSRNHKS